MRLTWRASFGWQTAIALTIPFLGGCIKKVSPVEIGDREQILHRGNGTEVQDLDPHTVSGVPEHHVIEALLEGLVAEDPKDLHPVPGVAERWDISPDGRVYTFHFRSNARWSNGDQVVANDFVQSYRRILSPALASEYSYMLWVVRNAKEFNEGKIKDFAEVGFRAPNDLTLEVNLNHPTPYFLSLLNHYSWFPVHIPTILKFGKFDERSTRWTLPGNFVGNGAFNLVKWKLQDQIVVRKSSTYWDADKVRLREIHFYPTESMEAEERSFRAGQYHVVYEAAPTKIDAYRKRWPHLLRVDPYLGTYFYRVNVTRPPLNDQRVRQALAMAIDREALIENVTRGGEPPAYNLTPQGTAGFYARAQIRADIPGAKELLAKAGYPDGKGFPKIELLFNTLEKHKTIAEAVQQMWRKNLNIEVELVNQEWRVYQDNMRRLDYQLARYGWIGDYNDPNSFLDMMLSASGNNQTGWANPEYDHAIEEAGRAQDSKERYEWFQKAEEILVNELPVIPVFFYTHPVLLRPSVKGWYPNILDRHPYKHVYLESRKPDSMITAR